MLPPHTIPTAALTVAIAMAAAPAVAQQPIPTLSVDHPCYSPGDRITFHGAGYTPGGSVNLVFGANERYGTTTVTADAAGGLTAEIETPEPDSFLNDDQLAADMFVTANDEARMGSDAPPENQFGAAQFRLSRWGVLYRTTGNRIAIGRRITFRAVGWTYAVGEPLYAHYRLGSRTVKTVRLGVLRGACGDLVKTLGDAFPFRRVPAGSYTIRFNASRDPMAKPFLQQPGVRVPRRDARR